MTDDDIFWLHKKGCPNRNKRAAKEEQTEGTMFDVEKKAKEIKCTQKSLQTYNIAELIVSLTYYQVMALSWMKKDSRVEKLKETLQSQKYATIFMKWSADEKHCPNSPQSQSLRQTQHWGGISRLLRYM